MTATGLQTRATPSATDLREAFDAVVPGTIGLEDEALLLDPRSLDVRPVAEQVVEHARDRRVKRELPAAQVELMTEPHDSVSDAIDELAELRHHLVGLTNGVVRPVAAAVHPFASPSAALSRGPRYDALAARHGMALRRQLVGALQIHVAVGGADRTLAVHDGLRAFLPELLALAAAAPFYGNRDTGLATVRPLICTLLPRQGPPPALDSWQRHARRLARLGDVTSWWWELRPHPGFGTLELRVPDVQPTLTATAGVAAFVHALAGYLAERFDAGAPLPSLGDRTLHRARNVALRSGLRGELPDPLDRDSPRPAAALLQAHIERLGETATRLGCPSELEQALALTEHNASELLRAAGAPRAAARWLADIYAT